MEEAAGLPGSPFSDLPIVRSRLESLGSPAKRDTLMPHPTPVPADPLPPQAVDADLAIAVGTSLRSLGSPPLAVDTASPSSPCDAPMPHPLPVPADPPPLLAIPAGLGNIEKVKQTSKEREFSQLALKTTQIERKVKNDLTVAIEVSLNGEEWHVLYPEQITAAEYEASLVPVEVSVRLREDYEIQSKIRIEEVSRILNVPRDFGDSFHGEAKRFAYKQAEDAEEEGRLSDERQKTITKKVNNAINRSAHRRQGCVYLCTAIILSVLLGSLIVCTIASFRLDYEAPEQYGLGVAVVLLLYCACVARNGFIGGTSGLSYRLQNRLRETGSEFQEYEAKGLSVQDNKYFLRTLAKRFEFEAQAKERPGSSGDEWSWRYFISKCCRLCTFLITIVCTVVFFVGSVVRSVEASNGEIWWLIVFLLIAFPLCCGFCLCVSFGPEDLHEDRCFFSFWTCVVTICSLCAMVVLAHGCLRAPESGTWMPPPILGWICLLMLGLVLLCYHTRRRGLMGLVAWCLDMEIQEFEAFLVQPTRSSLNATMLGVRQGTIAFEGSVLPNEPTIVSWPGKYESKWDSLVNEARQKDVSAAVVFLPEGSKHFGVHDRIPRKYRNPDSNYLFGPPPWECCQCWCYWLYGERKPWGCRWWTHWIRNIERAVNNENTLEVYFFDGKSGEGKVKDFATAGEEHKRRDKIFNKKVQFLESVEYGQALADGLGRLSHQNGSDSSSPFSREVHRLFLEWLSDADRQFLEDSEGLGNSQKAEVAWLEMHGYRYIEKEVAEFSPGATAPSPQAIGRRDSERHLLPSFGDRV